MHNLIMCITDWFMFGSFTCDTHLISDVELTHYILYESTNNNAIVAAATNIITKSNCCKYSLGTFFFDLLSHVWLLWRNWTVA